MLDVDDMHIKASFRMNKLLDLNTNKRDSSIDFKHLYTFNTEENVNRYVWHVSLVVRKPVFGVSDQVRFVSGCTTTEDG